MMQPLSSADSAIGAQEPTDTAPDCTVQVAAPALDAGLSAVQVWAYFSRDIGRVHTLQASETSGITLASPELLERIRATGPDREEAGAAQVNPIALGSEPNTARMWLNLFWAEAGEHEITVEGDRGRCRGTIRVDG